MPEGDTVWLTARRLHQALAGHTLVASDFRVPQHATVQLAGWVVESVASRGKHLLTRFTHPQHQPLTLHTHLRMDGSWHLYPPHATRLIQAVGPDWQIRVKLSTETRVAIGWRLPVVELLPTRNETQVVGHLGPDLLGTDWDETEAVRRLYTQPDREIGPALLDQRNLAGIGNLYKCEVLFLRGLHPWRPVSEVPDLQGVVRLAQRLLERNKLTPDQITTNAAPCAAKSQHHWVFERQSHPCHRCGTPITMAVQTEPAHPTQGRETFWCPKCQR